ncbi:MAG TPA: cytosine deaminase [Crinalium sp.]|jgi:cytosine deaminase
MIPNTNHYWLTNAHVPLPLLVNYPTTESGDVALVDLEIRDGAIAQIRPAGQPSSDDLNDDRPAVDLKRGLVWPCFVDLHTHLDKGHIWGRSPNRSGTFQDAVVTVEADREKYWEAEDVYRRMEFGLKCSYAHGTSAIRTHLDLVGEQAEISVGVFKSLKQDWSDRLTLQAVSLVPLETFLTDEGEKLARLMAEVGGTLGGLVLMAENLNAQLDRVFELAAAYGLNLDFHTDESGDPDDITLRYVAEAALRHNFTGQIVCGHCCSLAVQTPTEAMKTLELVKQAGIGIVSLPMCNLFLQDRNQIASHAFPPLSGSADAEPAVWNQFATHTPRWRGMTLLHELKHYGIPIAVSSDNCRDPFYGYGDHDGLEVFTQATRICQLDTPYSDWCRIVTTTPADLMGLPTQGRIGVGFPADLVLFKARYYSELFSRPQVDRVVLRNGQAIDTTLPDYAELDDLWMETH